MNRFLVLAVLAALCAGGCGKHTPAAAAAESSAGDQAPPSPRNPGFLTETGMVAVVADNGNVDATLAQLTSKLREFVMRTRSVPKNFDDFAARSNLQAPPPPAGKKYAIQEQSIVLVKK